jgi:hypothetical protein
MLLCSKHCVTRLDWLSIIVIFATPSIRSISSLSMCPKSATPIIQLSEEGKKKLVIIGCDLVKSGTSTHLVIRAGKRVLYVNTGSAPNFGDGSPAKLQVVGIWL